MHAPIIPHGTITIGRNNSAREAGKTRKVADHWWVFANRTYCCIPALYKDVYNIIEAAENRTEYSNAGREWYQCVSRRDIKSLCYSRYLNTIRAIIVHKDKEYIP